MKNIIQFFSLLFFALIAFAFSIDSTQPFINSVRNEAASFFSIGLTVDELVAKYKNSGSEEKIRILIVPGHEPDFGGAEYKTLKERDLNLLLSEKIKARLLKNKRFEVITTRDQKGWNPDLKNYIDQNRLAIQTWVNQMKKEMTRLVDNGKVEIMRSKVGHVKAPTNSAIFLYGINKWSTENNIEITLHLHFNDNPRYKGKPTFEGFSIYVPERQYSNSTSSRVLAEDLFKKMVGVQKVSTLKTESDGVIEDQELIALGSYNTSESLSVLIEYAYIYESTLQTDKKREEFLEKVSSATAEAVEEFFESRI